MYGIYMMNEAELRLLLVQAQRRNAPATAKRIEQRLVEQRLVERFARLEAMA
jgi:hypothetical protein